MVALLAGLALEWSESPRVPGRSLDRLLQDQILRWRASDAPETGVAVVDIDERSLGQLGPWPWPRDRLADMTEKILGDFGAKGVGLDFVLPQARPEESDERLLALATHAPVVFSQVFDYVTRAPALRVGVLADGHPAGRNDPDARPSVPATGFIGNYARLASATRCMGNIGLIPDEDGSIRRLPLRTRFEGVDYWPLSFVLAQCAGIPPQPQEADSQGFWRVPYLRNWSAYTVISAADVLADRVPRELLAGRLVLVGSSSFGLADRVTTPLTNSTAGVMVHAAATAALLDRMAVPTPRAHYLSTACLLAVFALGIWVLPRLPALRSAAMLIGSGVAWMVLAYGWLPANSEYSPGAPLLTVSLMLLLAVPYEWRLSQLESKRLLKTFRHYVAKPVLDELLSQTEVNPLEPRFLEVTTLVADMQGYAGLVENAPLREAVALTRDFLEVITRPVLDHGGTLDKYTGDGLMAFWGAPLLSQDHADRALDAALDMVAAVRAFNQRRVAAGQPALRVRIGIDSGAAVAGDLGTPFRGAYTAVGDSVNVASRLQEVARPMPYDVVIGAGTAHYARRHVLRSLGRIALRGRVNQLEIFTLEALT